MNRYIVIILLIISLIPVHGQGLSRSFNESEISATQKQIDSVLTFYENGEYKLAVEQYGKITKKRFGGHKLKIAMRDSYLELSKSDLANQSEHLAASKKFHEDGVSHYGESVMKDGYDADIYTILDEPAIFPGGYDELKEYIASEINYPQSAVDANIQGRVFVQFVINPNGQLEGLRVVKGVSDELDKEALRVMSEGPDWIPGKHRGEPVYVMMIQNINFSIKDHKKKRKKLKG